MVAKFRQNFRVQQTFKSFPVAPRKILFKIDSTGCIRKLVPIFSVQLRVNCLINERIFVILRYIRLFAVKRHFLCYIEKK